MASQTTISQANSLALEFHGTIEVITRALDNECFAEQKDGKVHPENFRNWQAFGDSLYKLKTAIEHLEVRIINATHDVKPSFEGVPVLP